MTRRTTILIVIVAETRETPSSTFPAAPAIDVEGEPVEEARPLRLAKCSTSNVIPLKRAV